MKRVLLLLVIGLFLLFASACSGKTTAPETDTSKKEDTVEPAPTPEPTPEPEPEPEPVPTVEFATEGYYVLFGILNEGYLVTATDLEMDSIVDLKEDGTGTDVRLP